MLDVVHPKRRSLRPHGHGDTITRVLTDNAKSHRVGTAWIAARAQSASAAGSPSLDARGPTTRPNGSTGPCSRMGLRHGRDQHDQRTAALDSWLEHYNTARSHSALGGRPPVSRLAAAQPVWPLHLAPPWRGDAELIRPPRHIGLLLSLPSRTGFRPAAHSDVTAASAGSSGPHSSSRRGVPRGVHVDHRGRASVPDG